VASRAGPRERRELGSRRASSAAGAGAGAAGRGRGRAAASPAGSRAPEALAFGEAPERPPSYERAYRRARKAWAAAALAPIGLHEARHTAASVMIAAGVNVKALSEFLGHASISTTLDRYGHLLPGSHAEAAALLDAYLDGAGAQTGARRPQTL
jgi:Phage integrase family